MLISPEEALRRILSGARPLKPERLPLRRAEGAHLAEKVRSDRDQPPADRSAMDGYAVIASDLREPPARLRLIGEVAAGSGLRPRVRSGSCAAIWTGGNIPPGADAVVPIEETRREGEEIVFLGNVEPGANLRRRGEEARRGSVLLEVGDRLGPAQIGACATAGKAEVKVHGRPRAMVICTGAEVRDVGHRVTVHELRDSNGPSLVAALAGHGFRDAARRIVPDDPRVIASHVRRASAARHTVVIITGGVSVGRYDFVPEAVLRAGGTIRIHGVSMKPGRPLLYATLPRGGHIFGLPGNPVSVLTAFHELVLPLLRRLSGAPMAACPPASVRLPLAEAVRSKGDRVVFTLARRGGSSVRPIRSAGSADLIAACKADGVIKIPEGVRELPAGAEVEFHPW